VEPVVATKSGKVRGIDRGGSVAFYGIPYAEPPFGALRFKAPQPVAPWDGVRDALEPAPTAPQPPQGFTLIPEPVIDGGDAPSCLSLNVFTPDLGASGLPVLVWIHGGGFTTGTPSSPWYDGRAFNRDGIVVVSIGYRLGAEGFLALEGAATNRGVRDWILGLQWVQDNVAAFGGDPSRVTIGGQSAGGAAVATLSVVAQARGLFSRVIPMSGSAGRALTDRSPDIAEKVAVHLGLRPTIEDFAGLTPKALVEAQSVALTGGDPDDGPLGGGMPYGPAIDGDLLTGNTFDAIASGAADATPFLIGATLEEFNMTQVGTELDDDHLAKRLGRMGMGEDAIARYKAAHTAKTNGQMFGQAVTDMIFRVPGVRIGEVRAGRADTFHYDFRWLSPGLGGVGACHCVDLPFAWDLLDAIAVSVIAGDAPPQQLADAMHAAWVGFIRDGDPGWATYDLERRPTMVFDETSKVVDDALSLERACWS
jgi:para-nitrobenzyl esterase